MRRAVLGYLSSISYCIRCSISMSTTPFIPTKNLKGFFAGSGCGRLSDTRTAKSIIDLTEKSPEDITVLYLGTATYDLKSFREVQTKTLKDAGCKIRQLDVTFEAPLKEHMTSIVQSADVILVSGGNTLYAVDRWKRLKLDELLHEAMFRGAVLAGGSAGAICWFQGGHSDSFDPDTYKCAMLDSEKNLNTQSEAKEWDYIRVDGLGFLPGLICPHHDQIQSNGVLRATDFDDMLLRHPYEQGIGIDHWSALEIKDGRYRIVSFDEKDGSVLPDQSFSKERKGKPGVWMKRVYDGQVHSTLLPDSGFVKDILYFPHEVSKDPRVEICRQENPDSGASP